MSLLGGLHNGNSHSCGCRKSKVRVSAGLVSSEASLLGLLDGHLPVSSHDLSPVCVHVCVQISSSRRIQLILNWGPP